MFLYILIIVLLGFYLFCHKYVMAQKQTVETMRANKML